MDFSGCSSDAAFGPTVQGCRGGFDFTIKFEKIFLSLIPSSLFIAISVMRSLWLCPKHAIVRGRSLLSIKLGTITAYAALQLSLVVLSSTESSKLATIFVSSAVLELVASLSMVVLSFLEHTRSPRPSILLNAYLFLTLLFDVAQTRTLQLAAVTRADRIFASIFTGTTAVKAILTLAESYQKSRWLQWNFEDHSPEETSGLYSLGAFFWLNKLFLTGYKKFLSLDDLLPLDRAISTEVLEMRLESFLKIHPTHGQKFGLFKAIVRTLAVPLMLPIAPRIGLLGFSLCQPFLINSVLLYLELPASERSFNVGVGLIGATIIIYSGIALSTAFYRYLQERTLWMARGALAGAIYKKTAQSPISVTNDSAALTLMSTDIERVRIGFESIHEFWACSIQIGLASWLLYTELGIAFVAPIIIVAICTVCIATLTRISGKWQMDWMEKIQKRVGITSTTIASMKHLKISGLTGPVEALVQQLRVDEIKAGSKWRTTMILAFVIGFTPTMIGPVVTFAFKARDLGVTKIFTSLSFLTLLTSPLSQIFQFIPPLIASFTCLQRIQDFLDNDSREDFREVQLIQHAEKQTEAISPEIPAAAEVKKGNFGWEKGKTILQDLNFNLPSRGLTIVVGPIASGKSTLCKALLGELPVHDGHVAIHLASSRIGFCDQIPFLSNSTIRENIIGYSMFNQFRYNEVVAATMLMPDLAVLPQGDYTTVGSNGITLSGGQKQRVSLARALYLEAEILLFDDILSGLDADTEEQVFQRVFGPEGLIRRRKATAVLCTHSVRHLPQADHIIALGLKGNLVEQGTFQQLVANESYVHSLGVEVAAGGSGRVTSEDERTLTSSPVQAHPEAPPASDDIDMSSRQTGDSAVYKHYAKSMKPITLISVFVLNIAIGFLWNFPQIWLNYWSTDVAASHMSHSQSYWAGIYALLQILCLICISAAGFIVFVTINAQSGTKLHHQALRTVINAPLRFFTKTDAGIVTNLFSQDLSLIDIELPQSFLNMMLSIFVFIGMACVVATSSPYITIGYPFLIGILWLIQRFYLRTSRQLRLLDLEAKSPLYTHFADTIKGVATLRAFGWIEESIKHNNKLIDNSQRPSYLLAMIQHWLTFILYVLVAVLATLVLVLTTQVKSITSAGFTGASLVTLMAFGDMVSLLITTYTQMETSIGAVSRLKSFSETVLPETLPGEDLIPPMGWPAHGAVEISAVSAAYSVSDDDESAESLTLKDLTMSIRPGEKVAICGRSGSGKSSTILLLLRLLDPISGCSENITIDGIQLSKIDRATLRQRIIALPQDPVFLPDGASVRLNLDPYNIASDEECRDVLETVALPQLTEGTSGLDQAISTSTLSQGQKQLFSLARAILRQRIRSRETVHPLIVSEKPRENPSLSTMESTKGGVLNNTGGLLLLDEVSSSVDRETDQAMQAIIKKEFAEYTIIMVSHRLDMVMDFNKVFILDKGSIIESGNPRELVKQEGSSFQELWAIGQYQN